MGEREPDASPQVSPSRTHTGEGGGVGASDAPAGSSAAEFVITEPGVTDAHWEAAAAALTGHATEFERVQAVARALADAERAEPQHCPLGCPGGACETCACCCAGWCVYGIDGLPEAPEDFQRWLEVAAEHNPVAALLASSQTSAGRGIGDDPRPAGHHGVSSVALAASAGATA